MGAVKLKPKKASLALVTTYKSAAGITLHEVNSKRASHMPDALDDIIIAKMLEIDPKGFALAYAIKDGNYLTGLAARALTALKVREKTNKNDGYMVEMIQKVGGGQKGWAWCAYHGQTCVGIAETLTGIASLLPWSGSCAEIRRLCPKSIQIDAKDIQFGDQAVKKYTKTGTGHYATIDHEITEGVSFGANEGNTTAGRIGDKVVREGGGAYYTERKIKDSDGNWIMFIRPFSLVSSDVKPTPVEHNPEPADESNVPNYGEISDRVTAFQNALNRHGASLKVDGKFFELTKAACAKFQKEHGLKGTGIPGPQTMALLMGAVSTPELAGTPTNPNFQYLFDTAVLDADRVEEVRKVCNRIRLNQSTYMKIAAILNCKWEFVGLVHYRESSALTLDVYLHNGQKLGAATTIVPKGVFFRKDQFIEASVDAMARFKNVQSWGEFLGLAEKFNGLGYRNKKGDHGVVEYSPYIVSGTNHGDETGKYVSDGVYSPTAVDKQLGVLALAKGLA